MERPYWKHEEEVEETRNISLDDVIEHAEMLFTNASFLCFAHGNIDKEQVMYCTRLSTACIYNVVTHTQLYIDNLRMLVAELCRLTVRNCAG